MFVTIIRDNERRFSYQVRSIYTTQYCAVEAGQRSHEIYFRTSISSVWHFDPLDGMWVHEPDCRDKTQRFGSSETRESAEAHPIPASLGGVCSLLQLLRATEYCS